MRIISLNLWGGRLYDRLSKFIRSRIDATDIFCFQELLDQSAPGDRAQMDVRKVYAQREEEYIFNLRSRLDRLLQGFQNRVSLPYSDFGERLGMYWKEGLAEEAGEVEVCSPIVRRLYGISFGIGSRMQWVRTAEGLLVAHVHGLWMPEGKGDAPERLVQSRKILQTLDGLPGRKALLGDFNLLPSTESVTIIESRMRNLIREYGVQTTRSGFAVGSKGRFADYVFISPEANLLEFKVLSDEVSDHLPLYLEVE